MKYYFLILFIFLLYFSYVTATSETKKQIDADFIELNTTDVYIFYDSQDLEFFGQILQQEVEKRTRKRFILKNQKYSYDQEYQEEKIQLSSSFSIYLKIDLNQNIPTTSQQKEGFSIISLNNGVEIIGKSIRGVLFGIGKFLRLSKLDWTETYHQSYTSNILIPISLNISEQPEYWIRSQMISYRALSDSYDGWSIEQIEQYIRELAFFGTNMIEVVGLDLKTSPHFLKTQESMIIDISYVIKKYHLNMSIWYPLQKGIHYEQLLKQIPRLDSLFIPGGDGGEFLGPKDILEFAKSQVPILKIYQPGCQIWVGPQEYNSTQMEEFFDYISKSEMDWLTGIVYGPHTRIDLPTFRKKLLSKLPLRHYPDLGHGLKSEFPNPNWSPSLAYIEGREVINPRPKQFADIVKLLGPETIGFGGYSDGCNDDVNKIIWSSMSWNSNINYSIYLKEYVRLLISPQFEDQFTFGLENLELNWMGDLNEVEHQNQISATLKIFLDIETQTNPRLLKNWRYQQGLFRAYLDSYVLSSFLYQQKVQKQAEDYLKQWEIIGSKDALLFAFAELEEKMKVIPNDDYLKKVYQYAESLYQSINLELSVERYKAESIGRGAVLDTLFVQTNNANFIKSEILQLLNKNSEKQIEGIKNILNGNNPGPGGFYDDLGVLSKEPHLKRGIGYEKDPSFYQTALDSFQEPFNVSAVPIFPASWYNWIESFYDAPINVYAIGHSGKMRLVADNSTLIHDYIDKPNPPKYLFFDIPCNTTSDSILLLSWNQPLGQGGNGRGNQIAELFLQVKEGENC